MVQQVDPLTLFTGLLTFADLASKGIEVVQQAKEMIGVLKKDESKNVAVGLVGAEGEVLDMEKNREAVAILVQISQPAFSAVKSYLAKNGIEANLFVISHDGGTFNGSQLDNETPAAWQALVSAFYEQLQKLKQTYNTRRYHLFIAGPAALAFALGAKLGKWYNVSVYNFDPHAGDYFHVLDTPDEQA